MIVPRRRFPHLAAIAAVLLAVSPVANAQGYPSRTVRIVVGGRDANEKLEHLAPLLSAVKALNDELETALAE